MRKCGLTRNIRVNLRCIIKRLIFAVRMSLFSVREQKEIDKNKAMLELEKTRREKLAGYFYNISLTTFSIGVLGVVVALFQGVEFNSGVGYLIGGSFSLGVGFGFLGNNKLK